MVVGVIAELADPIGVVGRSAGGSAARRLQRPRVSPESWFGRMDRSADVRSSTSTVLAGPLRSVPRRLRRRRHQGRAARRRRHLAQHGLARPPRRRDACGGSSPNRNKRTHRARPEGRRRPRRAAPAGAPTPTCWSRTSDRARSSGSGSARTCCSPATRRWSSPGSPASVRTGPYADRPGFATIAEAMSGFAAINGRARRPAAAAADRAHRRGHRRSSPPSPRWSALHSGVGQVVDVNLLESLFQLMGPLISRTD